MASNIWKLFALRALHMGLLMMPVLVVFWRSLGFTLTEIFALQAVFSAVLLLLEIPSGYAADMMGRRRTLIAGYGFLALGFGSFAGSHHYWQFVCGEVLLAVGVSLISGADVSMLYDTLLALGREREFARLQGRFVFYGQTSEAAAALLGGALALVFLRLPLLVYALQITAAFALSFALVEPPRDRMDAGHGENLRKVLRHVRGEPGLWRFMLFFAALAVSSLTAAWMYQPYWQASGVPLLWFGPLWGAMNLTVALAARWSADARERLGRERTLLLMACLPAAGYLGMGLCGAAWGAGFGLLIQVMRGFNGSLVSEEINRRVGSEMRATVNSLAAGGVRLLFCTVGLGLGAAADAWSVRAALIGAGALYGTAALAAFWLLDIRRRSKGRGMPAVLRGGEFGTN